MNVSVLTTGFDAPHVDLIAILRPTESVSLYQQIVGRGLRLAPGKTDCLILDYAGNPHDLYSPEVGTPKGKSDNVPVQVFCPACGFANTFWGKTTADGTLIEHFGRRCQGWFEDDEGHREQCDFRFRFKNCPQCNAENDIAARRCRECDTVLVDPDDMLKAALKLKDALVLRCSGMALQPGADDKGEWLKITYYDEDGADVSERFSTYACPAYGLRTTLYSPAHPYARCTAALDYRGRYRAPAGVTAPPGFCCGSYERTVLAGSGKGV